MASAKALLGAVAGRFLFRHGRVTQVARWSEHFVRFDVEGDELSSARFVPGDKVQLFLPDVGMRTYTPVEWNGRATFFIGFVHGDGPGSRFVGGVKVGDEAALFGPRRSIDASALDGPLVVVGDETSLGVAAALTRAKKERQVTALLESRFEAETRAAAEQLGLKTATVTAPGGLVTPLLAQLELGAVPVFTGRAASIQALKQAAKARGLRVEGPTKAYWAEGKRGLD